MGSQRQGTLMVLHRASPGSGLKKRSRGPRDRPEQARCNDRRCLTGHWGHSSPWREALLPLVLHFLPVRVPQLRVTTPTLQRHLLGWHLWPLFAATSFTSWRHRLSLVPCSKDKGSTAARTLPFSAFISQHRWAFLGVVFQGICTSFFSWAVFTCLSFIF